MGIKEEYLSDTQLAKDNQIMNYILQVVQLYFGLNENYYCTKNRNHKLLLPRQIASHFIRQKTKLSLHDIGEKYNKDHATIINGLKKVKNYLSFDKEFRKTMKEIAELIDVKSAAISESVDLGKDYYYIDMSNFTSIKLENNKHIILAGFSDEEAEEVALNTIGCIETKKHNNTGMYILEKKNEDGKEREENTGETA